MAEEIYQNLVRSADVNAPLSVHYLDLPQFDASMFDDKLTGTMQLVMDVVSLGRSARKQAGVKTRQPLRSVTVYAHDLTVHEVMVSHAEIIRDELNVKSIAEATHAADIAEFTLKPNLPVLGKKAGRLIPAIQKALQTDPERIYADLENSGAAPLDTEGVTFVLTKDDVVSSVSGRGGLFAASSANVVVAVDATVTPELRAEWYVREVEHFVQGRRKDSGYEVTDRVRLWLTCTDEQMAETLLAAKTDLAHDVLANEVTIVSGEVTEGVENLALDGSLVAVRLERQTDQSVN
jgi:isoleucyl-tRNA synthetase